MNGARREESDSAVIPDACAAGERESIKWLTRKNGFPLLASLGRE
jgi:hypothetical protein